DKYKKGKFKETEAPFEAYYLLANAYRINNDLDKALETYKFFKENMNNRIYDSIAMNNEIQSCYNAQDLMKTPFFVRETNLGPNVNDENSERYPVVNQDENMLVYSRILPFYDALLYSEKVNGQWSNPTNLNEALMVDDDLYPTSISNDGKTLFFYSTANYDGIIYSSTFENGKWSPIKELNSNINTKYWESHASISRDGKKLFFTSNRKGGYGGLDIYVSTWDETTKDWGPAVNLGPTVNTPYNEESPFMCNDDRTLYFSSRGHYNIGGFDILSTTLQSNGTWSAPINVGYPMNTTDDDVFFLPVKEGYEGYYAKEIDGGYGARDIYRVEIFSDDHPRNFEVSGNAKLGNRITTYNDPIKVTVNEINKNGAVNRLTETNTNPNTGEYSFNAKHGDYRIEYQAENGQTVSKDVTLSLYEISDQLRLDDVVVPLTKYAPDMTVRANRTITVTDGKPIDIPISIEPNATLEVDQYIKDELQKEDKIIPRDTEIIYTYTPPVGESKLTFTATDKYGNTASTDIFINRTNAPVANADQSQNQNQGQDRPRYTSAVSNQQLSDFLN
ncbi:MAG: PD40 domain-containing protein, partial [Bacteroidales bacterium]|nr:PD40 domain-containing protein [Bacteroidales bacterium]